MAIIRILHASLGRIRMDDIQKGDLQSEQSQLYSRWQASEEVQKWQCE